MIIDIILITIGACFMLVGLLGCVLPVIPGPPLCYIGLLFAYFTGLTDFSAGFLTITAALVIVVTVLDYVLPAWGVKRWGGSTAGTIGSIIGLVIGLFFGIVGILLGPFLGAMIAELIAGRSNDEAFRSGVGSLIGFVLGTGIKLALCVVLTYYFVAGLV